METLIKIISVCKSELITYQQLKELKKILNIKKKLIAGVLANNNFKFKLEESDVCLEPIIDEEKVIPYIDKKIKEIINKLVNNDKNNSVRYIKYSKKLIEACEDKNKLKDNFKTICSKYISLCHRIILTGSYKIDVKKLANIRVVKVNKIKPVFVIMAVANNNFGPTEFKYE